MHKGIVPLVALALLLAVLLPLTGCGSADQEDYFREMRKINKDLGTRLAALEEEAGEVDPSGRMELEEELVEVLERMAVALEEGILEMSRVKVPAGGEEAHLSLLELLSRAAEGYREAASVLNPQAAEGEGEHEVEEDESRAEESQGRLSEEAEKESHPSQASSEETGETSSH